MKTRKIVQAMAIVIPTSFNLISFTGCSTTENQNGNKPNQFDDRKLNPEQVPYQDSSRRDTVNDGGLRNQGGAIDTSLRMEPDHRR